MKKMTMNWLFMCLVATVAFFAGACSDDDGDEGVMTPVFPDKVAYNYAAGTSNTLEFEANMDWQLSSNAGWCKLNDYLDISGKAGKQSVTVKVTDEGQVVGANSVAQLTLKMGGKSTVIAEITRPAKDCEVVVKRIVRNEAGDEVEGEEVQVIEIGYDEIKYKVDANFIFAVSTEDERVAITRAEDIISVQIAEDAEKRYPFTGVKVSIYNEGATAQVDYQAEYKGMDPEVFDILPSSTWNAAFAVDGQSYTVTDGLSGNTIQYDAPYSFSVRTLNDEYEIVYVLKDDQWGCTLYQGGAGMTNWFNVEETAKGDFVMTVDENTDSQKRSGYVMAFPKSIYNAAGFDFDSDCLDEDNNYDLKQEVEKYVVIGFTQKAAGEGSSITFKLEYQLFNTSTNQAETVAYDEDLTSYDSQNGPGAAMDKYGTSNVWCAYLDSSLFPTCEQFLIYPEGMSQNIYSVTASVVAATSWDKDEIGVDWNDNYSYMMWGLNKLTATPGREMEITFTTYDEGIIAVLILGAY